MLKTVESCMALATRVREEVTPYYRTADAESGLARNEAAIRARMDAEALTHPDWSPFELKACLLETIADMATPVCFTTTPFPFDCGLRPRYSWGMNSAGAWLRDRLSTRFDVDGAVTAQQPFIDATVSWTYNPVDFDHCNLGYDRILARGIRGLLYDARDAQARLTDDEAHAFFDAAIRGLRALHRLTARFAAGYARAADDTLDEGGVLRQTAQALMRVPENPPETFFEALLTLSAWRELVASMEGMGISTLGHLDRLLYPYYQSDLAAGRLTEADARDLLTRYLVFHDCRFGDLHENAWAETSTTMNLGGCDADGNPVCNPLTFLLLRLHRELGLINPKPNCRISHTSDTQYLHELASNIAAGANTIAVYNDDVIIPAQHKMDKRLEDCRLYVNGGCQEPMLPGFEHSAGAHWYECLPRVLELTLHPELASRFPTLPIVPVTAPTTFEDVYAGVMNNLRALVAAQSELERRAGSQWPAVNPCPLISATLADCLEQGRDFTQGGARYNPTAICFVGFATFVDSLFAIRESVFTGAWCRYDDLRAALARDFSGGDALNTALRQLPHFGQDHPEADGFAGRVARDIAAVCQGLRNERGGPFQPALFSYYSFSWIGKSVGATPDGRHVGDWLSQGAGPSRLAHTPSVAHFLHGVGSIDYTDYPAIGVLDLQMPLTLNPDAMIDAYQALLRSFLAVGGPMLQISVVDPECLRQAQAHPAAYCDLVVRVSGYSAYFVALERQVQDEIISRPLVAV